MRLCGRWLCGVGWGVGGYVFDSGPFCVGVSRSLLDSLGGMLVRKSSATFGAMCGFISFWR